MNLSNGRLQSIAMIKSETRKWFGCRVLLAVLFFLFFSFPVNSQFIFSDLDLAGPASPGADNRLLFRASTSGVSAQNALFITRLSSIAGSAGITGTLQQLTVFPEKMDLLENGKTLQVRNSFGAVRITLPASLPMPIPGLPSFAGGNHASNGRVEEMVSSADGRWLLYLDPVNASEGNLVMLDVFSGSKTQIASMLPRPEKVFPASWSPDSRLFVYEKEGSLYHYVIGSSLVAGNEALRLIGNGTINSISWGRNGDFYYLRGSTLYHVRGLELFTRVLYSDFIEVGTVAGKIPFDYDPMFDNFWIAPDARSMLVSKGRMSLFYYPLGQNNSGGSAAPVLPYLMLPRSCSSVEVLWSTGGVMTVFVSIPHQAGTEVRAWRLNLSGNFSPSAMAAVNDGKAVVFESIAPPGSVIRSFTQAALSPDGKHAILWGKGGILLYDYANWKLLEVLSDQDGMSCLWLSGNSLIIADKRRIERVLLAQPSASEPKVSIIAGRELVCLSSAAQAGFEDRDSRILAGFTDSAVGINAGAGAWYITDGRNPWKAIDNPQPRKASQVSSQYRVFLEKQTGGIYANLPMIRNISSVGTFPLFQPPEKSNMHASSKEMALCFDLYDDDHGLPETLDALNRFGIKATFFLSGEFIRRHPEAAHAIAAAGHEAASMFFASIDLSDAKYRADADFIVRGLGRNEDEFFRAAGKELSLLWHPPWYMLSNEVTAAAAKAGYITVNRHVDPRDWVSREDEKKYGLPSRSSSEMVNYILSNARHGSVIPVRLGLLSGGRNDYLFNRINVLIDALIREGFVLTTASKIIRK